MRASLSGRQGQAGKRKVGNERIRGIRGIDCDVGVAATGRETEILRRAHVVGTATIGEAEDAAIVGLAFVLERQRAVAVGRPDRKSTRLNSSHGSISYAV